MGVIGAHYTREERPWVIVLNRDYFHFYFFEHRYLCLHGCGPVQTAMGLSRQPYVGPDGRGSVPTAVGLS